MALAGLAGAFLAMRALINPYAGPAQLIFAFEAVVIGGIGSLWGTLIGGIVLGVAQSVGATISPQWFQLAGHLRVPGGARRPPLRRACAPSRRLARRPRR